MKNVNYENTYNFTYLVFVFVILCQAATVTLKVGCILLIRRQNRCTLGLCVQKFPAEHFWKFIVVFPGFSVNLLVIYVNQLFPSLALQSDAVK